VLGVFKESEIQIADEVLQESLDPASTYRTYCCVDEDNRALGYVCWGATPCTVGTYDLYWMAVAPESQGSDLRFASVSCAAMHRPVMVIGQDRMSADSPFVELQCGSCGAQLRIDPGQRTARCPFCDAPSVVDRPAAPGRPMPVFALGFAVEREAATRAVRDWIRSRRMAPFGLRNLAVERMSGVYLPAYLYSATANSRYEASIAEKYKKVRIERDDDGYSVGRREETEYRDLTGRHVASLADILVTASHNVSNEEIQAIEPFDLGRLRRYTPALLRVCSTTSCRVTASDHCGITRSSKRSRLT
jgi:hypothetical protein